MRRIPLAVLCLVAASLAVTPFDADAAVINFTTPDGVFAECQGHDGEVGHGSLMVYKEQGVTIKMGSTFANKGYECLVIQNGDLGPIVNHVGSYGPLQSWYGDQGPPFAITSQFEITRVRLDFNSGHISGSPCMQLFVGGVTITCSFTGDIVFADYGITNLTQFNIFYIGGSGGASTRAFLSEIEVPEPALISLIAFGLAPLLRRERTRT